ncbi:MAG: ARMT1-like domain-containing protein [Candidatus Thorarchaeota archaeon]
MNPDEIEVPLAPECSACIVNSLMTMVSLITDDTSRQFEMLSHALREISEGYRSRTRPHALSLKIYLDLYSSSGVDDPYRPIKERSIRAALEALPAIEPRIQEMNGYDRFRAAIAASITGNLIDFNTAAHRPTLDTISTDFCRVLEAGFTPDHTTTLWEEVRSRVGRVLFVGDNAGEHVLDALLVREFDKMGWDCVYAVKGAAMINDVTLGDVRGSEIERLARVITTGARAHGVPLSHVSSEFIETMKRSDIVISKGQANLETLPFIQTRTGVAVYYLLRAKCPHMARRIGVPVGSNVVLRSPPLR